MLYLSLPRRISLSHYLLHCTTSYDLSSVPGIAVGNKLTDAQAERLLEYYWSLIAMLDLEDDIHVYASGVAFVDELANALDDYLSEN